MENPSVPRTCRKCNQVKERILKKVFADGSKYFVDEHGKKWLGLVCPACTYKARQDYYEPVEHSKATCKICNKEYTQKTSNQLYCGVPCSLKATANATRKSAAKKIGEE